jgi:hypothetical protein
MTTNTENDKNQPEMEESKSNDLNIKSLKTNTNSKNFFTMDDELSSMYADDVKVLCDDNTGVCTFVFIKKHVKAKMAGRAITLDAIHHEGVLEVKLPYTPAFLLARYMTEVYKNLQTRKSKDLRFGPTGAM